MTTERKPRKRRKKSWSYQAGQRGHVVRVGEDTVGGMLYLLYPEKRTLGHRDREKAQAYAHEQAEALAKGQDVDHGPVTLGRVLAAYLAHHTPSKSLTNRSEDDRRAEMFTTMFGANRPVERIGDTAAWIRYLDARRSGAITARGEPVPDDQRTPLVRNAAMEAECHWLVQVLNWATAFEVGGTPLLTYSPITVSRLKKALGTRWPEVKRADKRRPLATLARFQQVRAVADQVTALRIENGRRERVPTYLPEVLDITWWTGRRISAVLQLWYSDFLPIWINPKSGKRAPHGAVRFRKETDKKRIERHAILSPDARAAFERILRQRPGIGDTPIFPAMNGRRVGPITRHTANGWLRAAEQVAKLDHLEHGCWQPYRRGFATGRKHLPPQDVAEAGGWGSIEVMMSCYQQADDDTTYTATTSPVWATGQA